MLGLNRMSIKKTLPLLQVIMAAVSLPFISKAGASYFFDPSMLTYHTKQNNELSDLTLITTGTQIPDKYLVDVLINKERIARKEINFVIAEHPFSFAKEYNNSGLVACLTQEDIIAFGIKLPATKTNEKECTIIDSETLNIKSKLNFENMTLDINVPQTYVNNNPRGWIPPELWDEGIDALMLNWRYSGQRYSSGYGSYNGNYFFLTSGVNFGPWRLRDNRTWSIYTNNNNRWKESNRLNTYLQRAIIPWRSELTIGNGTTQTELFDSYQFSGVQLMSSDQMDPDSIRGFAPIIQGTASSDAEVIIRQNGHVIHRVFVSAGNFRITDLYPPSFGGNLNVSIIESNGVTQSFIVPYSTIPGLQREGNLRYEVVAGRFRGDNDIYTSPGFAAMTLQAGLPQNVTISTGVQKSSDYQSFAGGVGFSLGDLGAITTDITYAESKLVDDSFHRGYSMKLAYGHTFIDSGTTLQLAGYRYSSRDFFTFAETALKRMSGWYNGYFSGDKVDADWAEYYNLKNSKQNKVQVNISQRFNDRTSLYLNLTRQSYWGERSTETLINGGISRSFQWGNANLQYGYGAFGKNSRDNRTLALSLSIPFEYLAGSKRRSFWSNSGVGIDHNGRTTSYTGISGAAFDDSRLNWNFTQGYDDTHGNSGALNLSLQERYGIYSMGYSYSKTYKQIRYATAGSAILHSNGLTFGQPMGHTNVLIEAPGGEGILVDRTSGIRTDWRGYTVLPYARMFRNNRIALDLNTIDNRTEIDNNVINVIPTKGALVSAKFKIRSGYRALFTLKNKTNFLPLGTVVSSDDNSITGLVGEQGQVFISGLAEKGKFYAKWGREKKQQCVFNYSFTGHDKSKPLMFDTLICNDKPTN